MTEPDAGVGENGGGGSYARPPGMAGVLEEGE